METSIIHQSLISSLPPFLPSLLPMPLPDIYYSHSVIYFLQTRRKRPLPVLKELAASQGFNDWGLVQWWGEEASSSVRINPPTPGDPERMTHIHNSPTPTRLFCIHIIVIVPFPTMHILCFTFLLQLQFSHLFFPLTLTLLTSIRRIEGCPSLSAFSPSSPNPLLLTDYLLYSPPPTLLDLLLHFTALVQLKHSRFCCAHLHTQGR